MKIRLTEPGGDLLQGAQLIYGGYENTKKNRLMPDHHMPMDIYYGKNIAPRRRSQ